MGGEASRRVRRTALILGFGAWGSVSLVAAEPARSPDRTAPVAFADGVRVGGDFLLEGFEGAFPPAGWTRTGNPAVTGARRWHATTDPIYVRSGSQSALVRWQDEHIQDEKLASPRLDLSGANPSGLRFSFWWYGNPFWADEADFQIHASSDSTTWTELWKTLDLTETGWAWRQTVLDVSGYAGGDLFVRFRYKGRNGGDVAVDDVRVGYLEPPTPPENDDCAGALAHGYTIGPQTGTFSIRADNSLATHDYVLSGASSCTGYSHTGRDLVWVVDMPAETYFTVTMTTLGNWDDTLFLVSDCANPQTSCVAGENRVPDGSNVTLINFEPFPVRYYLVASGYAAGVGEFDLDGILGLGTPIAPTTWGRIKSGYR